jgi:succinyl-diaminopimelate desuccinylase
LLAAKGHRAHERLVLEDLRRATQVAALTLAELLAPEARSLASTDDIVP